MVQPVPLPSLTRRRFAALASALSLVPLWPRRALSALPALSIAPGLMARGPRCFPFCPDHPLHDLDDRPPRPPAPARVRPLVHILKERT